MYGSTRENGNTETLTERAIKNLSAHRIFLKDLEITHIVDQRHEESGFTKVQDDYDQVILSMIDADVIIFATPIYWYGMSSVMKMFTDRWSQTARDDKFPNFKKSMTNKPVYLIAVGGDKPKIKGLPLVQQFKYVCEFMEFTFKDYILGKGVKPNDIVFDKESLHQAKTINDTLMENHRTLRT
ncbi:flavodoxin family protein [Thalassobacillus sp. CUG 92003]|uniref:flavodoxin family protein n=1 Tax=Thalassobacillus sp. CUG 92003 TaxID=2736641 RepID=UPI0015E78A36|nr:flavodoxin family protein [Thalassobacillus sp. CUG 92003]